MSFGQKRSVLMNLLQLGNEEINSVLFASDNAAYVQSLIGLNEVKLPGQAQRNKQMREILLLISAEPTQNPETGQVLSSVPVEPNVDDNMVHVETLIEFITSNTGQDLKEANQAGYANCLAPVSYTHLRAHETPEHL